MQSRISRLGKLKKSCHKTKGLQGSKAIGQMMRGRIVKMCFTSIVAAAGRQRLVQYPDLFLHVGSLPLRVSKCT